MAKSSYQGIDVVKTKHGYTAYLYDWCGDSVWKSTTPAKFYDLWLPNVKLLADELGISVNVVKE